MNKLAQISALNDSILSAITNNDRSVLHQLREKRARLLEALGSEKSDEREPEKET